MKGEGLDYLSLVLQMPAPLAGCSSWCQVATHHTFSQAQLLTLCKQLSAVALLLRLRAWARQALLWLLPNSQISAQLWRPNLSSGGACSLPLKEFSILRSYWSWEPGPRVGRAGLMGPELSTRSGDSPGRSGLWILVLATNPCSAWLWTSLIFSSI